MTNGEQTVSISELKPYPLNPRRGNTAAIVESLEHHGQYRPIVVNQRTSEVLAGNHTLAAAKQLGWTQIAATFVDVDADQAARIVLVDNRANDLAAYHGPTLVELIADLDTLSGTGYTPEALANLAAALSVPGAEEWTDALTSLPEGARTTEQQMTFTLHRSQLDTVETIIDNYGPGAEHQPRRELEGEAVADAAARYLEARNG